MSRSNIGESEMTTTSAARSVLCARTKSSRWTLPTSSSPSMKNLMFSGRWPAFFMCASTALMCMNTCPLSSADPRA
jgi:hypothetical protein